MGIEQRIAVRGKYRVSLLMLLSVDRSYCCVFVTFTKYVNFEEVGMNAECGSIIYVIGMAN